jgi:hypothetical protein
MDIPEDLIELTKEFLEEKGINQFKKWYKKYKTVSPIYKKDNIIYITDWREGRAIISFMKKSGFCKEWTDEDFLNNWKILIEAIIL